MCQKDISSKDNHSRLSKRTQREISEAKSSESPDNTDEITRIQLALGHINERFHDIREDTDKFVKFHLRLAEESKTFNSLALRMEQLLDNEHAKHKHSHQHKHSQKADNTNTELSGQLDKLLDSRLEEIYEEIDHKISYHLHYKALSLMT